MADIEKEVGKLTKDKVEDLEPGTPLTVAPPEPTKEKIWEVVALLQHKSENGDYRGIATKVGAGMKTSQVKRIHKAMLARQRQLASEAAVEEEG